MERVRAAARAELQAEQERRSPVRKLRRLARWAKKVAEWIGVLTTVVGAVTGLYRYIQARRAVPPPELPANGTPSTALDFPKTAPREDPPAPDGSVPGGRDPQQRNEGEE